MIMYKVVAVALLCLLPGCWFNECACLEVQRAKLGAVGGPTTTAPVKLNAEIPPGVNLTACVC